MELAKAPQAVNPKVRQKPIELLKALIAAGGDAVAVTRLADLLWPEADGDQAARSFKTTLSRLRKLLGSNDLLVLQDGRLSLNRRLCWVDTWRFEEVVLAVSQAARPQARETRLDALRELAARLQRAYPGPFLRDCPDGWADADRRRLHGKYERSVGQLAQLLAKRGACETAAALTDAAIRL